jgi:hypothetical protein
LVQLARRVRQQRQLRRSVRLPLLRPHRRSMFQHNMFPGSRFLGNRHRRMLRNHPRLGPPQRRLQARRGLLGRHPRLVRLRLVRQRIPRTQFIRHRSSRRSSARRQQPHPEFLLRNRDSLHSGLGFRRKDRELRRNVLVGLRVQRAVRRLRANGRHFDRASLCRIGLARRKACVQRRRPGSRVQAASHTLAANPHDFRNVQVKADRAKVLADLVQEGRVRAGRAPEDQAA